MSNDLNYPPIPDYHPIILAGQGSFGEVFLVEDALGNLCALKVLHWANFNSLDEYKREFDALRNYMAFSREHPGLVSIHHVGGNPGEDFYYYVMDPADPINPDGDIVSYVPLTLKEKIESAQGGLPPREVLEISIQLASAIQFLHDQELIHRDIKPDNIVFINGEPKFTDPGLVKDAEVEGSFVGTHGYIAPEGPGYGSDQYALGKTIYRMLTGNHARDFPDMPTQCLAGEDANLSIFLNDVCNKACEFNPSERFQDVGELEACLLAAEQKAENQQAPRPAKRLSRRILLATSVIAGGAISVPFLLKRFPRATPVGLIPSGRNIAGWDHSLFLDQDGEVWACGNNEFSQLGIPGKRLVATPTRVSGLPGKIISVAAGDSHSLFLTNMGELWAVGRNNQGQLGVGDADDRMEPVKIPGVMDVQSIAASGSHSLLLKIDGSLWAMGKTLDGRLGTDSDSPLFSPTQIPWAASQADKIAAGSGHIFFIYQGQLYGLGRNQYGRLGDGSSVDRSVPSLVLNTQGVVEVATGYAHTLFIRDDGSLWGFGQNDRGQLGQGDVGHLAEPVNIHCPQRAISISCGQYFSLVLMEDSSLYGIGSNRNGQLGVNGTSLSALTEIADGVTSIWAGKSHSLFTRKGQLHALGENQYGQLGDGTFESKWKPEVWNIS